nr:retrovirus-related Pol polyprotein from transposon TNT 1-94 [Tanacetum cinerariifolium]
MVACQRKPEGQWTADERKAVNLDNRLKSLIMSILPDDQMNSVINCLTAKSTWDDVILSYEGPSDVKESRVMDLKLCCNTLKFKEGETLTQTFTKYKALMNELVNDGIKLLKLEINTGFINGLPKKWISFCQSVRNTNHVKDSKLASLFGDNDDRKNYLDYLCIDQNYVEEQRNNLLLKHRSLVQELNSCKEQLLELKQAKLDFLTMQHVNTMILKENQNLRKELKELTEITKTWLNSSNKVNQCISEQIPSQKKRIVRVDQLTKDHSSSDQKDIVFVKSSTDDTKVSIPADESSLCITPLPPLQKLDGAKPVSRPKTIKSILRGNKSSSALKVNSAPAGKLKSVKIEDGPPLAIVMKELNDLNYKSARINHLTPQITNLNRTCDHAEYMSTMNMSKHLKNQGGSSSRSITPRPSKHFFPPCIHCGFSDHLSDDCVNYPIKFDKKANDAYFLGYSLVSKAFRVFNTRRQQTEETYHIIFDESPDAIKFTKPLVDNINIAESERYPPDEYIHLVSLLKGDLGARILTQAMTKELSAASAHECLFVDFLSEEEPKKVSKALQHPGWIDVMQEELNQFARNKVWTLVPTPYGKTIIGSKWVFRNKRDETGIVIKNKSRLVAQGYNQQEGIDYDETFAPQDSKQS